MVSPDVWIKLYIPSINKCMEQYKNADGTYTSPKNGKIYKNERSLRSHLFFKRTEKFHNFSTLNAEKTPCNFCNEEKSVTGIKKHEKSCYLNPLNVTLCKVCDSPINDYRNSKGTCSHSCSNKLFRRLRNKPENYSRYTTICWKEHKKECVVCGENKVVAVHHMNEDHNDNRVENLVPLCPTHHIYMHSKYKEEILPKVEEYIRQFNLRFA